MLEPADEVQTDDHAAAKEAVEQPTADGGSPVEESEKKSPRSRIDWRTFVRDNARMLITIALLGAGISGSRPSPKTRRNRAPTVSLMPARSRAWATRYLAVHCADATSHLLFMRIQTTVSLSSSDLPPFLLVLVKDPVRMAVFPN